MDIQRLSEADRISSLLLKRMAGTLTQEEKAEVDTWTAQSQQRQTYADLLDDTNFLQEEYHRQKDIDAHQALRRMQQRIDGNRPASPVVLRYAVAAVLTVFIVGGLFWYWQYAKVVPPTISAEVQEAMVQSVESGRQEALVEPVAAISQDKHQVVKILKQTFNITSDDVVEQLLEAKRITTRSDREYWLTLPDGSLVHLNYNTHVIYPERFIGDTRDVILDGEAYFMVAKDRRHPFIVHTPQGDIKEYGTEFNVSTRGEAGTEVVLVDGSISVTPTNGKEQMMQPGQMAKLSTADCQLSTTDVDPYVAWNTGKFSFHDQPLGKILEVIGRWYGYQVLFASDDLKQITLTGSFSRYEDVHPILRSLETATESQITINHSEINVTQ